MAHRLLKIVQMAETTVTQNSCLSNNSCFVIYQLAKMLPKWLVRPRARIFSLPAYSVTTDISVWVCCCGLGGQEKSIDRGGRRAPQRAVSRCQLTQEVEHGLV